MHGEAAKLWWTRNGDPKLLKDKNLAEVMLKTKNATDLHVATTRPNTPPSVLNITNVDTLPNWDVNSEYERWFEASEIDTVERNGNTFSMREMCTYSLCRIGY